MKLLVFIVIVLVVSHAQCELFIERLFGAVKNTTIAIKEDIAGAVNYGKTVVFGRNDQANKTQIIKKEFPRTGIIDRLSLKIHDVAADVREHFRSAITVFDKDQNGNRLFGRMFNKIKTDIINVKGLLFGNKETGEIKKDKCKLNSNTALLCDKLKNYIFKNDSIDSGIQKTLHSFKKAVDMVRENITKLNQKHNNSDTDGAGLIDIRSTLGGLAENVQNNLDNIDDSVDAAYDKVEDDNNLIQRKPLNSNNTLERDTINLIENQRNSSLNIGEEIKYNSNNPIKSHIKNDINDTKLFLSNALNGTDKVGQTLH